MLKQKDCKKYYLYAFLSCVVTGLLFILPFYIKNMGIYYLGSDFVEQQIPFWTYCNQAVKSGNIWWAPNIDLGTSFFGAFTFYVIGSPFFWFSLLFKAESIYQLAGFLLIIKMGVSGLTSFAYIKRYVKQEKWAVVACVVYTFCGYSISNMNFNHFYDVTALFPLLLLALDLAVIEEKKGYFAIAVALSALCNAVLFAGEVIFLILYFVVKLVCKEYQLTLKKFFTLAFESLLGIGLSCVLLIPTVFSLLDNPRVSNFFPDITSMVVLKPIYWAEIIRSLLFPAECIFDRGFYLQGFTNSAELYLPLFSVVLAIAFMVAHKKSWITKLLLVCAVFAVIPILNSSFVLFNAEYYTRWFYMPILILCLATAKALDQEEVSLKSGYAGYGVIWGLLGLVGVLFVFYFKVTFIYNIIPVLYYVAVSLAGFIFVLYLRKIQRLKQGFATILSAVILVSASTGFVNSYYHARTRAADKVTDYYTVNNQVSLPKDDMGYRIHSEYYFMNLGTMLQLPTVTTFASNISASSFEFYDSMGIPRTVITSLSEQDKALMAFLSVKYRLSLETPPQEFTSPYYSKGEKMGNYTVAEYENFLPMGFVVDCYITHSEFQNLSALEKQYALLNALVLTEEQINRHGDILSAVDGSFTQRLDDVALKETVDRLKENTAHYFAYTKDGAFSKINLDKEQMVLYTIPYDKGFCVKVNGKEIDYEKVDNSFIALRLPKGNHEIQFHYRPQGFRIGLWISIVSGFILLGYCGLFFFKKRARK